MGATYWTNYLANKTVSAKVSAIIDSGIFTISYVNPFLKLPILTYSNIALLSLATDEKGSGLPDLILQCINDNKLPINEFYLCLNTANLAKYLSVPTLFIQSSYDPVNHYYNLIGSSDKLCLNDEDFVQSLQDCSERERKAIEDLRLQLLK